jgi:hypothetical protein
MARAGCVTNGQAGDSVVQQLHYITEIIEIFTAVNNVRLQSYSDCREITEMPIRSGRACLLICRNLRMIGGRLQFAVHTAMCFITLRRTNSPFIVPPQ